MVPPIPELTSGRKVKGTKTRCHTMTEIGISLMTGQKLLHNAYYNSRTHGWLLCGSASRLGLHGHWVAAQVMWTKTLPTLLLSYLLSPYFPSSQSHNTHTHTHTQTRTHSRIAVTGIYRATPLRVTRRQRAVKAVYWTYVDVIHFRKTDTRRLRARA